MKPSLQLTMGQHLTLTPQLQQAIRLLQLSTFDLQQEIQQTLESNPMLEAASVEEKEENSDSDIREMEESNDFQWSQLYASSKQSNFNENTYNFENVYGTTTTLQDHLEWQLNVSVMSDTDRAIAAVIIDAINNAGFLTQSLSEIHNSLNSKNYPLSLAEIETVRHRIQHLDPLGCGSITLAECLLIQVEALGKTTPYFKIMKQILSEDLALLGRHNYPALIKKYQITEEVLKKIIHTIQSLNPSPGYLIQQDNIEYVIPDLLVKKSNGQWTVSLNQTLLPHLSINHQYAALITRANNSADNQFLKNNLQEARWFLKSIQSRQDTLLKAASCIMEYQQGFLESGEEAMKPLVLNEIAGALDMHESTISRVTTQKYIHTPRGVFELKYFFSSHVPTSRGGECSSTAIRAMIKKLIAAENGSKPLSDNKLAQLINAQGIEIARRTVAKYREAMGIEPSHERKIPHY